MASGYTADGSSPEFDSSGRPVETSTAHERLSADDDTADGGDIIRPTLRETDWAAQHAPRFDAVCDRVAAAGDDLRVLEVGSEPYHLTNRLLDLPAVGDLTVINRGTSADLGREDRLQLPNGSATVRYCNVEAHSWPVDGSAFDVIVAGAILEHLFHPAFALHQARMVAREQTGRLVLSTPNAMSLKQWGGMALRRETPFDGFGLRDGSPALYNRHQREYTRAELVDLLTKTGWHTTASDVQGVTLNRSGRAGALYERLAGMRETLADQWIVDAHAGTQWVGRPEVYREGLIDREGHQ